MHQLIKDLIEATGQREAASQMRREEYYAGACKRQQAAVEALEAALAPSEPVPETERRCARDGRCRWTDGRDERSCNLARSEILCSEFVDADEVPEELAREIAQRAMAANSTKSSDGENDPEHSSALWSEFVDVFAEKKSLCSQNAPESPDGSNDREILGSSSTSAPSTGAERPDDPEADCERMGFPTPQEPGWYWAERKYDPYGVGLEVVEVVRAVDVHTREPTDTLCITRGSWLAQNSRLDDHLWRSGKLPPPVRGTK